MPDILKIGYSTKDPSLRAKELAGTGSPHPFRVVFDILVEDPRKNRKIGVRLELNNLAKNRKNRGQTRIK